MKKILPVIIRGDGFSSRNELDELLKPVEQLLSGGHIVQVRAAVHTAYEEISLPKQALGEQEHTHAAVISLAQKRAREAGDAAFKDVRNRGPLPRLCVDSHLVFLEITQNERKRYCTCWSSSSSCWSY